MTKKFNPTALFTLLQILGSTVLTGCYRPIGAAQNTRASTATDAEKESGTTASDAAESEKARAENARSLFQQALKLSQDQLWDEASAVLKQSVAVDSTPDTAGHGNVPV